MEKIFIEYLRTDSVQEEIDIELFWIEIRNDIYQIESDTSLIYYNLRRGHASAYIGDYAGIFIQVLLTLVPFAEATLSIWEKVATHLKNKREKGKVVRVLNLPLLESLCRYDLFTNKEIKKADLIKSEKLIDRTIEGYSTDYDFTYEENLDKVDCAKIIFENKKHTFVYVIASDGDITSFERIEKSN